MDDRIRKKTLAILRVLKSAGLPQTGGNIATALGNQGIDISERTVRYYLQKTAAGKLTKSCGRKGHVITAAGIHALDSSPIFERVGFLSAKIDQMTYRMNFDLATRTGTVVLNVSLMNPQLLADSIDLICRVFQKNYAMGHLATLLYPGEKCADTVVPEGMIGFGTVCSITLNGVLLKHGVPTRSQFGGLLELRNGNVIRFSEIITYDGTTIDPLEIFIRSGMTSYIGAVTKGTGQIGASFREIPDGSRDLVVDLAQKLGNIGLGGFMDIGYGGQPLLDIPVNEGRAGAIVIGGLNPVAVIAEKGHRVISRALAGLIEFNRLFPYTELPDRINEAISRISAKAY